MSMWRKTLVYLGLVEEPEEHDEMPERLSGRANDQVRGNDQMPPRQVPSQEDERVPMDRAPAEDRTERVRPLAPVAESGGAHVRPMAAGLGARVHIVAVTDFDDGAAEIGRQYRMGTPVLFDMADAEPATARRILDFVSGVTFALRGQMVKASSRAFLVVPDGIELPASERERLAALGYGGSA